MTAISAQPGLLLKKMPERYPEEYERYTIVEDTPFGEAHGICSYCGAKRINVFGVCGNCKKKKKY